MHVEPPILGGRVPMRTDAPGSTGFTSMPGNSVYINLEPATRAETDRRFKALALNGRVEMPQQDMCWGGCFGSLAGQFGVRWLFNGASKA